MILSYLLEVKYFTEGYLNYRNTDNLCLSYSAACCGGGLDGVN